jgi:hypothetical protein
MLHNHLNPVLQLNLVVLLDLGFLEPQPDLLRHLYQLDRVRHLFQLDRVRQLVRVLQLDQLHLEVLLHLADQLVLGVRLGLQVLAHLAVQLHLI